MRKVFTGGAFDLLHYAHVLFLEECAKHGDYLVVEVNSDARVKHKKGPSRPILPEEDRMAIVGALRCVDEVVTRSGESDYPVFKTLTEVKPDVCVINVDEFADYSELEEFCQWNNIELVKIPRIIAPSGLDTSKIVEKIKKGTKW